MRVAPVASSRTALVTASKGATFSRASDTENEERDEMNNVSTTTSTETAKTKEFEEPILPRLKLVEPVEQQSANQGT